MFTELSRPRRDLAGGVLAATPESTAQDGRYAVLVASEPAEIRAAQRLRHAVFAGELGARLPTAAPGLDVDDLDQYCDHLIVRDERTGAVIGTYRMLPSHRAAAAGRLYSDGEFDLTVLAPLRPSIVEVGRSCVHPDHRNGSVINLMWSGIARYMLLSGHRWLAGCASVPLGDGGAGATAVWNYLRERHLAPAEYRVTPRNPWPVPAAGSAARRSAGRAALPPLLRGYLRLGAWVCGEPAHDPDFGVADLFVLLAMDRIDDRYLRHFLGEEYRPTPAPPR
jgi:putative hemolysin